jgi:hypothetical protein
VGVIILKDYPSSQLLLLWFYLQLDWKQYECYY